MTVESGESVLLLSNFQVPNSSVYLWDLDHGFAGVILIKKATEKAPKGCWDSIHVFECQEKSRSAHYKLTSTVMLWLQTNTKVITQLLDLVIMILGRWNDEPWWLSYATIGKRHAFGCQLATRD